MITHSNEQRHPMLGASGAIMGLAGMYLVLAPVHRIYMTIWLRMGLMTGFRLLWKLWAVRGFWVVLFYIAFDVLATLIGSRDGTAHWAHLGGFVAGWLYMRVPPGQSLDRLRQRIAQAPDVPDEPPRAVPPRSLPRSRPEPSSPVATGSCASSRREGWARSTRPRTSRWAPRSH